MHCTSAAFSSSAACACTVGVTTCSKTGAADWQRRELNLQHRYRIRCHRRSSSHKTSALLQLFRRGNGGSTGGGVAFKKKDLVQMGPLKVSPMGFGTWAWGNKFLWDYDKSMDAELQRVFNFMVGRGINLFDTADSYGTGALNGRSEQLLGQFTKEAPVTEAVRGNICIATKLAAYPWRLTSGQMVKACRGSLNRLGAQQAAIGQLHWSASRYAPFQERALWDGLVAIYEQGLVQAVGVSNYGPKQLERIHRYLDDRGVPLASAQVQYSLLSKGPDQEATLELCRALGIAVIAYSPLGLGMLTGRYSGDEVPRGPRGVLFRQILPGIEALLDTMRRIAASRQKTVSQVAINWCICQGTVPIPGAKTMAQAEDNIGALGWRLTPNEITALSAAADEAPTRMIQNIFQTK